MENKKLVLGITVRPTELVLVVPEMPEGTREREAIKFMAAGLEHLHTFGTHFFQFTGVYAGNELRKALKLWYRIVHPHGQYKDLAGAGYADSHSPEFIEGLTKVPVDPATVNTSVTAPYYIGKFTLSQPIVRVTDPCYGRDTHCAGTTTMVPGNYIAEIVHQDEGRWGKRVACLRIYHESLTSAFFKTHRRGFTNTGIDVGVDSGQAGFYDDAKFKPGSTADNDEADKKWEALYYDTGLIGDFGVASRTGDGDGSYDCYRHESGLAACITYYHKQALGFGVRVKTSPFKKHNKRKPKCKTR